jgi:hypothetical protein
MTAELSIGGSGTGVKKRVRYFIIDEYNIALFGCDGYIILQPHTRVFITLTGGL